MEGGPGGWGNSSRSVICKQACPFPKNKNCSHNEGKKRMCTSQVAFNEKFKKYLFFISKDTASL